MRSQVISWFLILFVTISPVLASPSGWVSPKCTLRTREQRTRQVPYTESYQEHEWGNTYRMQWRTKYKTENYTVVINEIICCKGYDPVDEYCKPHCSSTCDNGYCAKPYTCECSPGFRLLSHDSENCVPTCREPCVNGKCIAHSNCENDNCPVANYCECNDGYEKNDYDVCVPVCKKNCENETCTAVDACDCPAGYEKNIDTLQCLPICSRTCENGVCVAPDTCACYDGWKLVKDNYICEPLCKSCVNGDCIAPENCVCHDGFVKDKVDGGTCLSICEPKCVHGVCSIEGCSCNIGWSGKSCEEPLLCDITEPVRRNVSVTVRLPEVAEAPESHQVKWKGPACHLNCIKELDTLTINFTQSHELFNQHFIPIGSPCNLASVGWVLPKKYMIPTAAGIGLLACASTIATVIKRRKRMLKTKLENRSSQCGSADDCERAEKNFVRMKYRLHNRNESFPYGSSYFQQGSEVI